MPARTIFGLIFWICATVSAAPCIAQNPLHIIGGTVPFVLHPKQQGPHNHIFEQLIQGGNDQQIEKSMLPYARALRDFQAKQYDCFYATTTNPAYFPETLRSTGALIFSQPVNSIQLRTFTRAGTTPISGWRDLEGKTIVGTRNQLRAIRQRVTDAQYITVFNAAKAFELLAIGRADVAAVYGMDAYLTAETGAIASIQKGPSGQTQFVFDDTFSAVEWGEVMVCWTSKRSAQLIHAFDQQIEALRNSGELEALFAPFKP